MQGVNSQMRPKSVAIVPESPPAVTKPCALERMRSMHLVSVALRPTLWAMALMEEDGLRAYLPAQIPKPVEQFACLRRCLLAGPVLAMPTKDRAEFPISRTTPAP